MRFDDIKPIIEGKLYEWAAYRRMKGYPAAGISKVYEGQVGKTETPNHASPQEAWVIRKQAQVYESGIIESTLKRMNSEQRRLVYLRYVERNRWDYIADDIGVERRTAYRIRDQVIAALSVALEIYAERGGAA